MSLLASLTTQFMILCNLSLTHSKKSWTSTSKIIHHQMLILATFQALTLLSSTFKKKLTASMRSLKI
ncbi:putative non-structure protein 2h [SARS coronavirus ZJ0301]|uniref:Putative non-structure protein 2h n=2 Tax=Severe acute respiratory syndrome coronavirus TaxID=694009 RepID=Q3S2C5_SARS|nr:putative non-structure protein 2h [SARS coronavirus ZJ01]ABA02267.1 putative non-structure protein 2h [SARS coronavirus ZJ0301]